MTAALAQHRVTRLAAERTVHRAFHWLHLHQLQMQQWLLEFVAIPAPPFSENARAAWFAEKFEALGLVDVETDAEGNVLGLLAAGEGPVVLLSAHLDTVFAAGTNCVPREEEGVIYAPGACDNGAGLSALLGIAAALKFAGVSAPILFAANVGEEGEGDLRGMRALLERGGYRGRIRTALALEGAGTAVAVTRALGSRRFRVTVTGPGGHSWTDAGVANPILLLSEALVRLASLPMLRLAEPRTTFSPGRISGGDSVNSIPSSATVDLDLRSTDAQQLGRLVLEMHRVFEGVAAGVGLKVVGIGDRPAGELDPGGMLLASLRAVDRHLGLATELRVGSTDANLPLALGIPAMALAAGGVGGGIHTLGEWYDPGGRETALRRVLLVLMDAANG